MWALVAALFFLQAPDYSAEGLKALDASHYQEAADAFQKAVAADPKDYTAHFNLGLAYGFLHRDAEGVAEYRKTLHLKPGLYEADLNCAILLLRQHDAAGALPLLADAAKQKPNEFRPRYYLAEAELQTGALDQAAADYRLALGIDAKSGAAELGLGRTLLRQGNLAEAVQHYKQAATLDPKLRQSLLELAEAYEKDHQTAEALAIYRQFPDDPAVQAHAGELMLDSKQYTEAIPRLEEAYAKEPTEENRVALAQAYVFARELAKALPLIDLAASAEPANFDIRMMYGRALRDSKQYPKAAAQFQQAVKLKPTDAAAWTDMAGMLDLSGDLPDAYAAFEKAHQLGDTSPGNCFFRAIILDRMHQLKPALAAYQEFLAMSQGKHPDQEFQARQRARIIRSELERR
jgi:tetratricopeptide (TPR) repeat protein